MDINMKNEKYMKSQTTTINDNTFYIQKNLSFTYELQLFCVVGYLKHNFYKETQTLLYIYMHWSCRSCPLTQISR